jgi:hypothetical protein
VVGEVERELEVLDLDRTEIPLDPVPLALATYTLRRRRPLDRPRRVAGLGSRAGWRQLSENRGLELEPGGALTR